MRTTTKPVLAALLTGLLLAGCTPDPDPTTSPTPPPSTTASASPTESVSPVPTSTLSAEEQEAVDGATEALMAARQIGVDLYSGARTNINDLDAVTTGDFHDETIQGVSQNLAQGWTSEPKGVQLTLVSSEPLTINLKKDPPSVVIRACVDGTDVIAVSPKGKKTPGIREELDYTVVYTTNRPNPVWAVSRVTGAADVKDRAC